MAAARTVVGDLFLVTLDDRLLDAAAELPVEIRSLDAIHLAAALSIGSDLGVLVTYDERMARAADALGIEIASP
jgi:predicted nucleic acid-binding protein